MFQLKVVRERRAGYGQRRRFTKAQEVYAAFCDRWERADREEFIVIPLDAKNHQLGFHVVSVGTLTSSLIHPREVFKVAYLANAAGMLLLHNHPSGDPFPSAEDLAITKKLIQASEILGIRILDHVIIGDGRFVSFVDDGYMAQVTPTFL